MGVDAVMLVRTPEPLDDKEMLALKSALALRFPQTEGQLQRLPYGGEELLALGAGRFHSPGDGRYWPSIRALGEGLLTMLPRGSVMAYVSDAVFDVAPDFSTLERWEDACATRDEEWEKYGWLEINDELDVAKWAPLAERHTTVVIGGTKVDLGIDAHLLAPFARTSLSACSCGAGPWSAAEEPAAYRQHLAEEAARVLLAERNALLSVVRRLAAAQPGSEVLVSRAWIGDELFVGEEGRLVAAALRDPEGDLA